MSLDDFLCVKLFGFWHLFPLSRVCLDTRRQIDAWHPGLRLAVRPVFTRYGLSGLTTLLYILPSRVSRLCKYND